MLTFSGNEEIQTAPLGLSEHLIIFAQLSFNLSVKYSENNNQHNSTSVCVMRGITSRIQAISF